MQRRTFLKLGGLGLGASLLLGRRAFGSGFGAFPGALADRGIPEGRRVDNVLEVFMMGGLSQWETLYHVDAYGRPDDPDHPNTQSYAFGGTDPTSLLAALGRCGLPETEALGAPFARDANGVDVRLGPFAATLRERADFTDRLRILVQQHELEPHEAAVPLALTGKPLGNPGQAGFGTHIERYFREQLGSRSTPYSYVISPNQIVQAEIQVSTGLHPSSARPTLIKLDSNEGFYRSLFRPGVGSQDQRAQYDRLLAWKTARYRERLRWRGVGDPLRSGAYRELGDATSALPDAGALAGLLEPRLFEAVEGTSCGDTSDFDSTLMGFTLAAHLLTHPTQPARYVCVEDRGISTNPIENYDTHTDNSQWQARNFMHLFRQLAKIVNEPGEDDPRKLDLDRTLIILNTEFGRTPWRDPIAPTGRNHHPYAYTTALIGGPITPGQRGISGAIGPDGLTTGGITPGMNRIAALLALGIYPFSRESFEFSDVTDAGDEASAVDAVAERCLGYAP